jgi:hypothetical protein
MYALHSWMSKLDYAVEPEVECLDDDPNDAAFIRATATIGGRDAVKEYIACRMYPLAACFSFESVPLGMTLVSKVDTPLPVFAVGNAAVEHADRLLAEIETEAEKMLGSFRPKEYDALFMVNILSGGCLNRVIEQMGVPYATRPLPGSKASQVAIKKWKAEVSKKPSAKRVKAGPSRAAPSKMAPPPPKSGLTKKISILKIAQPKAKPGPRGTSEIELALARPIGVSKKFHLLDVAASSHGLHAVGITGTRVAQVLAFDNLGDDSSSDVHKTPSPIRTVEIRASPSPLVSRMFLCFSFAFVILGPNNCFAGAAQPPPRWICH